MNVKGNAVAVVLVIAAIMVVLVVSTQFNVSLNAEPENQSNQKIHSETSLTIDEALNAGTEKFLQNGFSSQSKVWYYNSTLVPDINHMDNSYNFLAESEIAQLLDNLAITKLDYAISYYDLDVNAFAPLNPNNFNELNDGEVNFDVNVFTSSTDGTKVLKAPDEESLGLPVWKLYKNLYSWVAYNPSFFGNVVVSAVEYAVPSTYAKCSCNLSDTLLDKATEQANCQNVGANILADINSQLRNEMTNLNALFSNSQITCTVEITDYNYVCNDVREQQFCIYDDTETASLKCKSRSLKSANVSAFNEWSEKKGADPDNLSLKSKQIVYPSETDLFPASNDAPYNPGQISCGAGALAKEHVLTLNPKIFVQAKVTCTDYSQIIGLFNEQKNLSSEIVFKVAIRRNVNPSTKLNVATNLDPTCSAGGGGPGGGGGEMSTPCTPPSTLCVGLTGSCYLYECYQTGMARPIYDQSGNKIPANCCGGGGNGNGNGTSCAPLNSCYTATGTQPNCVQTPKDCTTDLCSTGLCDTSLANGCVPKPLTDDGNLCTTERCDAATGQILHEPKICTAVYDSATGSYVYQDPPCSTIGCNESTGACEIKTKTVCPTDGNYCSEEKCVSSRGGCVRDNRFCAGTSAPPCTIIDCNAFALDIQPNGEQGKCQTTTLNCNDNNGCTTDACVASSGCSNTFASPACPQVSYGQCGNTKCISLSESTSQCVIDNPVDCTLQYLQYSPKECYYWSNTCYLGSCSKAPTAKCLEVVKQYCYAQADLAAHGCTIAAGPDKCCYTLGQ